MYVLQHFATFLFLTSQLSGEVYYLLYSDEYEIPSKVAFDPEEPSLGRIRADSVAPPHSPASIKQCISRVEGAPALAHANLFADISCNTPLKEGYISILRTEGPGLSPSDPMAIVQMPIVQVKSSSIPDGRYVIKNRAANVYWKARGATSSSSMMMVYFVPTVNVLAKEPSFLQVNKHSPITLIFKRIILFQSGTLHMIQAVTSSS